MRTTTPAPITNPAMEPKSSQLPIKPRLRSGEYSATKIDAPVYSPPTEKPLRHFTQQQQDRRPDAYRGIRRNQADTESTYRHDHDGYCEDFLPTIFIAQHPENRPPNGRIKNGTEKVPSAAIICTLGLASGRRLYLRRRPQSHRRRNRTTPSRYPGRPR